MNVQAFTPGQTITILATSSTASANFTGGNVGSQSCILQNTGTGLCFVRLTVGASTAVTTDFPLPPGTVMTVCKGLADTLSAICPSAVTTTIYATAGEGQ